MYPEQQFAVIIAVTDCNENGFNAPIERKKERILPSSFRMLHHDQTHTSSEIHLTTITSLKLKEIFKFPRNYTSEFVSFHEIIRPNL